MGKNKNKNYESNLLDRAPVAEEGYNVNEATVEAPVVDEVENLASEPEAVVEAAEPEAPVEKEPEKKYGFVEETQPRTYGVISNKCARLNVREAASTTAKISAVVNAGTKVRIDKSKSEGDFHFIILDSGTSGFAMKEYIDEV